MVRAGGKKAFRMQSLVSRPKVETHSPLVRASHEKLHRCSARTGSLACLATLWFENLGHRQ